MLVENNVPIPLAEFDFDVIKKAYITLRVKLVKIHNIFLPYETK
jgi:hypothetical protein